MKKWMNFFRKPSSLGSGAMKLGGKTRDVDSFVDQLKEEGENVAASHNPNPSIKVVSSTVDNIPTEP